MITFIEFEEISDTGVFTKSLNVAFIRSIVKKDDGGAKVWCHSGFDRQVITAKNYDLFMKTLYAAREVEIVSEKQIEELHGVKCNEMD